MKKPHVLNRAMFNRGGTSAYGRGITSNLVSDEQRQRFNYGGRVGLAWGANQNWNALRPQNTGLEYEDLFATDTISPASNQLDYWALYGDPEAREDLEWQRGREKIVEEQMQEAKESSPGHPLQFEEVEELKKSQIRAPGIEPGTLPTDRESDVIDWTEFAEGLYDKKKTLGGAQFGAAGTILAASQLPKKEAAVLLGKGMGEFAKTIGGRREKIEDIAATGKMYEKVNVAKAAEAGKWAVAAEKIKQGILNSDTAVYNKAAAKDGPKEGLEAVVKFDITSAPTKDGQLDVEAMVAKGEGQIGQFGGQFILTIEDGKILGPADAGDIQTAYSEWKARKKLANSPTS